MVALLCYSLTNKKGVNCVQILAGNTVIRYQVYDLQRPYLLRVGCFLAWRLESYYKDFAKHMF